jgi:hypothetical protein
MQRQLVAKIHPPNFAHHFHTDHPVFSCSKIEQKQLNTWVSFRSAATLRRPIEVVTDMSKSRAMGFTAY